VTDFESHYVVAPKTGLVRARVFLLASGVAVMQTRIDDYAVRERTFPSLERLEGYVKQRRWVLEKARHFG
jgi:hypothetical protein